MREAAKAVVERLQSRGFEAYWAGGCVRDQLLGREPADYDVATNARVEEIERLFPDTVAVGRAFGVLIVRWGGHSVQTATFRAESDYTDHRRPDSVRFCDAQEDASRRDFTINGLFFDPISATLHDWTGGQSDLHAKRIRAIGNPVDRFAEDHLRMLRAVRLAAQLGFDIDEQTFNAVKNRASDIRSVSSERIRDELLKLFQPPHAAHGLDLLRDSGLLSEVLPEIASFIGCAQSPEFHPEGTVYEHVRLMLSRLPVDAAPALVWSVLLHDVGKPVTATVDAQSGHIRFLGHESVGAVIAERVLVRLRFPRKEIEEIVFCVSHHMQFKDVPEMRKSTLRRVLMRPTFRLELELHRLDCLASSGRMETVKLLEEESALLAARPELLPALVTGADVIAAGIPEGQRVGTMLAQVRELQLGEELRTREEALAWLRENAPKQSGELI